MGGRRGEGGYCVMLCYVVLCCVMLCVGWMNEFDLFEFEVFAELRRRHPAAESAVCGSARAADSRGALPSGRETHPPELPAGSLSTLAGRRLDSGRSIHLSVYPSIYPSIMKSLNPSIHSKKKKKKKTASICSFRKF